MRRLRQLIAPSVKLDEGGTRKVCKKAATSPAEPWTFCSSLKLLISFSAYLLETRNKQNPQLSNGPISGEDTSWPSDQQVKPQKAPGQSANWRVRNGYCCVARPSWAISILGRTIVDGPSMAFALALLGATIPLVDPSRAVMGVGLWPS